MGNELGRYGADDPICCTQSFPIAKGPSAEPVPPSMLLTSMNTHLPPECCDQVLVDEPGRSLCLFAAVTYKQLACHLGDKYLTITAGP